VTNRRQLLLDAALTVLGELGARGFTHRAVDAAAGVPSGTTSNHFLTRNALVEAVVERFVDLEMAAWEHIAGAVDVRTVRQLATALATFAHDATGPNRTLTVARFGILVEAARQPELQTRLTAAAAQIRDAGSVWLRSLGAANPARDTQIILDHLDGVILHQLAFPNTAFDPTPALELLIGAIVRNEPGSTVRPDAADGNQVLVRDPWVRREP
jgi:DNA-binding transcriptional regulator YbjK